MGSSPISGALIFAGRCFGAGHQQAGEQCRGHWLNEVWSSSVWALCFLVGVLVLVTSRQESNAGGTG